MPGQSLSLEEFNALATTDDSPPDNTPPATKIDPEVQATRDDEARRIVAKELETAQPSDKKVVAKELQRDQKKGRKSLSLEEFKAAAGETTPTETPAPTAAPKPGEKPKSPDGKPEGYWAQVYAGVKRDARSAASLADMAINTFGSLAGSIGSVASEAQFMVDGKSHKEAGKAALEFGHGVSEALSFGNPFAKAVAGLLGDGEVTKSALEGAMETIGKQVKDKGGKLETLTHGVITEEDVAIGTEFLTNVLGAKGLVKLGKAGFKALRPDAEAAPKPAAGAKPVPGAPDVSKPKVDFKSYQQFLKEQGEREAKAAAPKEKPATPETPKDPAAEKAAAAEKEKVNYKEWIKHLKETTQAAGIAEGEAQTAKAAAHPVNKNMPKGTSPKSRGSLEGGKVTPEHLWNMAAVSVGAAAGAYLDPENPIVAGVMGAIMGTAATVPGIKTLDKVTQGFVDAVKGQTPPGGEMRITSLLWQRNKELELGGLNAWRTQMNLWDLAPTEAEQIAIAHAVEGGTIHGVLAPNIQQAVNLIKKTMVDAGNRGVKAGVLAGLRENYITHIVDPAYHTKAKALFDPKILGGAKTSTPFSQLRSFPTLSALKAAGIPVVTERAADILGMYLRSLEHAIANKNFVENLQMTRGPAGQVLAAKLGTAGAKGMVSAGLPGILVHPDIADSVRFMFEAKEVNGIAAAGLAVNTAIKRMEVMNPLFHTRSLFEARLGSVWPWQLGRVAKDMGKLMLPRVFGEHAVIEQIRHGGPGNGVERLLAAGGKISFPRLEPSDIDIHGGYYKALGQLQRAIDNHFGKVAGAPLRASTKLNHAVDNFMWGRNHAGLKVMTFLEESSAVMRNAGKRGMFITAEAADRIAATVNNLRYGGLNWQMMAESINNQFLRKVALQAVSPKGRAGMGFLAFAPDWNTSTLGMFMATLHRGSGPRGLFQPVTVADLARQQLMRSSLYYMAVANALNYNYSGHFIWDNGKDGRNIDWTYIDRGDGTKLPIAKHYAEPAHAIQHPGRFLLNKMGVVPSEVLDQVMGMEYVTTVQGKDGSTKIGGPPIQNRAYHALRRLAPIGTPNLKHGYGDAALSLAGMTPYGKTDEDKREEKKARRMEQYKKSLDAYKKANGLE